MLTNLANVSCNNGGASCCPGPVVVIPPANDPDVPPVPSPDHVQGQIYEQVTAEGDRYVWELDGAGMPVLIESPSNGKCTTYVDSSADVTYDAGNPPTAPTNPPANPGEGDTLSEMIDGAEVNYTFTNGSWVVSYLCPTNIGVPLKKDGSSYAKGDTYRPLDINELDNPLRGPLQDVQCVEGTQQATYCDGTQLCFQPDFDVFRASVLGQQTPIEVGQNNFIHPDLDYCVDIVVPKCGANIRIVMEDSWNPIGASAGQIAIRPQYSCNGGATWQTFNWGGINLVRGDQTDEQSFQNHATCFVPGGQHTICARINIGGNTLDNLLRTNRSDLMVTVPTMKCCEV